MDTFLSGLGMLAHLDVMIALLIGSIGGVVIGAIPGVGAAVVDAAGPPGSSGPPPRVVAPSATCLPALPGNERSRCSGAARDPRVHTSRSRPEEAIPHRRRVDRGATNAPSHRFGHVPWCRDHRG